MKRAEEEWKHHKVYGPKGHDDILLILLYIDLLYDFKGNGGRYGQFDLVYDPKRSQGH